MKKIINYLKSARETPILSVMFIPSLGFLMIIISYTEIQGISTWIGMISTFALGCLGVWSIIYQIKNYKSPTPPTDLKTWDDIFNYYNRNNVSDSLEYWLKKHYKDPTLK